MSIARRTAVGAAAVLLVACSSHAPSQTAGRTPPGVRGTASARPTPSTWAARERPRRLEIRPAGFSLPVAVQREVAVVDHGSVLVAGGLDAAGSSTSSEYRLSPGDGSVTRVGSFGTPFHDAAAALIGPRLVVFGGGPSSGTDLVQAQPGGVIGHLPTVSSDLDAAVVGGRILVVGGYDGTNYLTSVLATLDGTRFMRIGTLPEGLRYAAVASAGPNAVIVAGGLATSGPVDSILRITVPGGDVATIGKLPRPLAHATALALGGSVFVMGGEDASGQTVRTVERIDPRNGHVKQSNPLPGTVADAAAVALGRDRGLLIGGRRGPQGSDVPLATILSLRLA